VPAEVVIVRGSPKIGRSDFLVPGYDGCPERFAREHPTASRASGVMYTASISSRASARARTSTRVEAGACWSIKMRARPPSVQSPPLLAAAIENGSSRTSAPSLAATPTSSSKRRLRSVVGCW